MSKSGISYRFFEVLRTKITRNFGEEPRLLMGVSGGADSMALLYSLYKLGIPSSVSHINYSKRGAESDLDQELVEQMSFEWGFDCHTVRLDPIEAKGNFQNWARKQRYSIFRALMKDLGCSAITLAHHKDDQLETILQRILRGSSISTWSGMKVIDDDLFRPLLDFSKDDILEFCEEEHIPFREDSSNYESTYARNWLRRDWTEKMDTLFPGWKTNIMALQEKSTANKEAMDLIRSQVVRDQIFLTDSGLQISDALKRELWRNIADEWNENPSKGELGELINLEHSNPGISKTIGEMSFTRTRNGIFFGSDKSPAKTDRLISKTELEHDLRLGRNNYKITIRKPESAALYMSADDLKYPVRIRNWEHGDRFQPFGMNGSQKVSDHLTNVKVSSHLKEKTLVLCSEDGTIVAVIYPETVNGAHGMISEKVRAHQHSQEYLIIGKDHE